MSKIIPLFIRAFLFWVINRNDPDMIRLREMKRILRDKKTANEKIDRAVRTGDTVALSALWRELQARDGVDTERTSVSGP